MFLLYVFFGPIHSPTSDSWLCPVLPLSPQDCLALFFQQSTLTKGDQMWCPQCGVRRDTAVLTTLSQPPEVLILHLKRCMFCFFRHNIVM